MTPTAMLRAPMALMLGRLCAQAQTLSSPKCVQN
jgi:hypothetical protein